MFASHSIYNRKKNHIILNIKENMITRNTGIETTDLYDMTK